ncbi:zinc finger CCHC domain-containing protein 9 isoform X2 [Hemiscyllium ocellatum]|nr:zinc finger CCHC domain-containing protein 9 isoform X2 [Hemiscyllium ocellatum]XP_060700029.1 zinc finger CCHC domain-containing protein 9 isoform X2 [Hemiscyllium ocellatum]
MTRWARANNIHKKKVLDATPWSQLKQNGARDPSKTIVKNSRGEKQQAKDGRIPNKSKRKESEWYHIKEEYHSEDVNGFMDYLKETGQVLHKGTLVAADSEKLKVDAALALKKDQRREHRRLKRQMQKKNAMICFHCKKTGHGMDQCPEMDRDEEESGSGICYRCGSTEHEIRKCRAKVDPALGEFPFAKCFICGEMGHLSRSCPDNPKGLYADGRCCRLCGSVEHFQKDCPDHQNMNHSVLTVARWTEGMSADYEEIPVTSNTHKAKPKVPKTVNF